LIATSIEHRKLATKSIIPRQHRRAAGAERDLESASIRQCTPMMTLTL
jgi:hypothetical protein